MANYWEESPERLRQAMLGAGIRRAFLLGKKDGSGMEASHPLFEDIAAAVSADRRDYRAHQGSFFEIGVESDHLLSAHVHWTMRGQAAGGVRFWSYDRGEDFVRDGLRLSVGMGQKNALAGLWWGGGKGVIARRPQVDHLDPQVRGRIYRDYGRMISGLRGCYITAEDVGTRPEDMASLHQTTRHATCIPSEVGGSGNPSIATATGVVVAMEAALEHLGRGSLEGKTLLMQGLGQVSQAMIDDLLQRHVRSIVAFDLDPCALADVKARYPSAPLELKQVAADDLSPYGIRADLFAPNAVGGILNPRTIPLLKAGVICGAANNQLEDVRRDAAALQQRGLHFVPDFLANRMGIVNCANEQYGTLSSDPAIQAHFERDNAHGIHQRVLEVFDRADASGKAPVDEAVALADELGRQEHPIWGNRAQAIIDDLVASGWAHAAPVGCA